MAKKILAALILMGVNTLGFAEWSCTTASGHTYTASQSVMSDTCTDLTTDAERAAAEAKPVEMKVKPFKSKPADARKAMDAGKAAVKNELKDPGSAQFRDLFTTRDFFLCGQVNAKNSYAGYVGFRRFVAMGEVGLVDFDDGSEKFSDKWFTSCEGFTQEFIDQQRRLLGK